MYLCGGFILRKFRIIYFIYLVIITIISLTPAKEANANKDKVFLYFVDRQIMKLIPVEHHISHGSTSKCAQQVVNELIAGRDYNDNIRRILPNNKNALKVKVEKGVATVNINTEYLSEIEDGRFIEELFVYQIVNSLSSVNGINRVKFLIDGKIQKSLFGSLDMREAYIPDYYI